jgi:hypothetical protein
MWISIHTRRQGTSDNCDPCQRPYRAEPPGRVTFHPDRDVVDLPRIALPLQRLSLQAQHGRRGVVWNEHCLSIALELGMGRSGSRRRFALWIVALAAAAAGGCSTVPPPVTSPLSRTSYGNAVTWSAAWGYARARVQGPDGTLQTLTGNGDSAWGDPDPSDSEIEALVPALISLHQVTGDWDTGEYIGWRRLGVTARRRLATTAGGAATSVVSALNAHWSLQGVDASLALEQSVPLARWVTALFRAGASYGLRDYDLEAPRSLTPTPAPPGGFGDPHFDILRTDLRVEPLVGLIFGDGSFILSFQPYFVVAQGAILSAGCADCVPGVQLLDFTQNFGFALALTVHEP